MITRIADHCNYIIRHWISVLYYVIRSSEWENFKLPEIDRFYRIWIFFCMSYAFYQLIDQQKKHPLLITKLTDKNVKGLKEKNIKFTIPKSSERPFGECVLYEILKQVRLTATSTHTPISTTVRSHIVQSWTRVLSQTIFDHRNILCNGRPC